VAFINNKKVIIMTISNQYELEQEAKSIAKCAMMEKREYGTNADDYIHQICDGHESVIYTYKAGLLCLECDRDNAEYHLLEIDYKAASYADYVTRLAYAILFDASITAFCELPQDEEEEEEMSAELETEIVQLLAAQK
tara:strand:+ start:364 stop:777 length:414 start_codon:yes stop_codon:yes gene_type:complete